MIQPAGEAGGSIKPGAVSPRYTDRRESKLAMRATDLECGESSDTPRKSRLDEVMDFAAKNVES